MPGSDRDRYLAAMGVQSWRLRQPLNGQDMPESSAASRILADSESSSVPVGELDWQALRQRVSACHACDLHKGRTQTVFGTGSQTASWLLVGEGPGEDEDLKGEPFVGRAGGLLNAMIRAVGAQRDQVYITNVVKCRPPANRNPKTSELASCAHFLERQIELLKPGLILAVGRVAANSLLQKDSALGKLRGQVYKYGAEQIPLVVTYHPAYLLRKPSDKVKAWADLRLAMSVAPATDNKS